METKVYGIRLTDEERKRLEMRAKKLGMTLAAYIKFMGTVEIETKVKRNGNQKSTQ